MTELIIGDNGQVSPDASIANDGDGTTRIGANATVRSGTIIYRDVVTGDDFQTGHNAVIRGDTVIGDDVLVGTNTVLDGSVTVGDHVSLQTNVYVPQNTRIGDEVFIGPQATITNDPFPIRERSTIQETVIEDHVSIGANAAILPGTTIGEGAFVAAGAVVTEDVPPDTLAIGAPARHESLPEHLVGGNQIA